MAEPASTLSVHNIACTRGYRDLFAGLDFALKCIEVVLGAGRLRMEFRIGGYLDMKTVAVLGPAGGRGGVLERA